MNGKTWILVLCAALVAGLGGWFAARTLPNAGSSASAPAGDGPCPGGAAALYWKAPMDPSYVRDEPGKSPMGMDLVPQCPGGNAAADDAPGIRIDSAMIQNMGVRTAPVERRDLTRAVRAVGRVDYDERLISHVHTKIQGWIEKLYVEYEGQTVRKGQRMAEIYSPELLATQEELLVAARYRESMQESNFADVREGGVNLYDATRRRLELWDIPDRDIDRLLETGEVRKTIPLYAHSSGVVTHMMARQGMEVGSNDNLYSIADLTHVWVYADVYEYELPWVAVGQRATIELRNMPGKSFDAEVTYVYPFLDPKTRTVRVRLELDNPDLLLKPEMFASVVIATETREAVLTVPNEAIIRSGRRDLAIVALGEGRFDPREVELGIESGDGWVEIVSGIEDGESVVTSGQFLIDSESKLQEAVQKLLGSAEPKELDEHAGHDMPQGEASMPKTAEPPSADPHAGHAMPPIEPEAQQNHDAMPHATDGD